MLPAPHSSVRACCLPHQQLNTRRAVQHARPTLHVIAPSIVLVSLLLPLLLLQIWGVQPLLGGCQPIYAAQQQQQVTTSTTTTISTAAGVAAPVAAPLARHTGPAVRGWRHRVLIWRVTPVTPVTKGSLSHWQGQTQVGQSSGMPCCVCVCCCRGPSLLLMCTTACGEVLSPSLSNTTCMLHCILSSVSTRMGSMHQKGHD
jgi:hypothetical protein